MVSKSQATKYWCIQYYTNQDKRIKFSLDIQYTFRLHFHVTLTRDEREHFPSFDWAVALAHEWSTLLLGRMSGPLILRAASRMTHSRRREWRQPALFLHFRGPMGKQQTSRFLPGIPGWPWWSSRVTRNRLKRSLTPKDTGQRSRWCGAFMEGA